MLVGDVLYRVPEIILPESDELMCAQDCKIVKCESSSGSSTSGANLPEKCARVVPSKPSNKTSQVPFQMKKAGSKDYTVRTFSIFVHHLSRTLNLCGPQKRSAKIHCAASPPV